MQLLCQMGLMIHDLRDREEGRFQLVFVSGKHKVLTPRWKALEKLYHAISSPLESFKPLGF